MEIVAIIIFLFVIATVGAIVAERKGRSELGWFFGCLLFPIAILIVLALPSIRSHPPRDYRPQNRSSTSPPNAGERQASTRVFDSWGPDENLRSEDMKLLEAAHRVRDAEYLLSNLRRKGKNGGIIDLPLADFDRDRLIGMLDASGREAFQQAYAHLADPKLHEESRIEVSDPEQATGEESPTVGNTNSQPAPVRSEFKPASAAEHGNDDDKGENLRNRLKLLKNYFDEGLITENEYTTKKLSILDDL